LIENGRVVIESGAQAMMGTEIIRKAYLGI
jgi:hypothetical protein